MITNVTRSITRDIVKQYVDEYKEHDVIVAALLEDYPELDNFSAFHRKPAIEVVLEDFNSYEEIENKEAII